MATPASTAAPSAPDPLKKVARTALVWGWCYIVTIFGAFGAGYVQPGPLRVLLLNLGILCFIIGVLELVWRHKLVQTRDARWARVLAWNQVGGTLVLAWSLYLLYMVPETILVEYSKHSAMWNNMLPVLKSLDKTHLMNDAFILNVWHGTKLFCVYVLGGALLLSQLWVVWHYLSSAKKIAANAAPPALPPVLK